MKDQFKTVNEISKLTGITVRALHYYDQIGLLKPSDTSCSGYRLYSDKDVIILQKILFLKEIGFELKQIKELLYKTQYDEKETLIKQKEILNLKKERIDNLINLIDRKLEGEKNMSFSEFDESEIIAKQKEYEEEVSQRFGNTDAYKEFKSKQMKNGNSSDAIKKFKEVKEIFKEIAALMEYSPGNEEVQKLIEGWKDYITKNYYTCTNEIFHGLAIMYVKDERFKKYFNSIKDNLAQYVSEAINIYCKNHK